MPSLDPFIDMLFKERGHELLLEAGRLMTMRDGQGTRSVSRAPLSRDQLISAVRQVAPASVEINGGLVNFRYVSPVGAVAIRYEPQGGALKVSVRRDVLIPPPAPVPAEAAAAAALELDEEEPGRKRIQVEAAPAVAGEAMQALLVRMVKERASDLHLCSNVEPFLRVDGDIVPLAGFGRLEPSRLREMLWTIAPEKYRVQFDSIHDSDFAYERADARFRVNLYADREGIGAVLRQIPTRILSAEQLGLPKQLTDLCRLSKGLVLVTGPTGSGKSTTLAALIDHANRNRDDHIITIEDPIEFVHPHRRCIVNQREIGVHTESFKNALRAALREDPDIVLVGELRDLETIAIAVETAETGHLVFGTLHTNTAASTIDRIIDQFPADRQGQIRMMLSESLKAVVAQTLCKKIGGGRVAALEILLGTSAVANLIREGKTFQIPSLMQTGRALGMQQLNDALFDLAKKKMISPEEAMAKSTSKAELRAQLQKAGLEKAAEEGG